MLLPKLVAYQTLEPYTSLFSSSTRLVSPLPQPFSTSFRLPEMSQPPTLAPAPMSRYAQLVSAKLDGVALDPLRQPFLASSSTAQHSFIFPVAPRRPSVSYTAPNDPSPASGMSATDPSHPRPQPLVPSTQHSSTLLSSSSAYPTVSRHRHESFLSGPSILPDAREGNAQSTGDSACSTEPSFGGDWSDPAASLAYLDGRGPASWATSGPRQPRPQGHDGLPGGFISWEMDVCRALISPSEGKAKRPMDGEWDDAGRALKSIRMEQQVSASDRAACYPSHSYPLHSQTFPSSSLSSSSSLPSSSATRSFIATSPFNYSPYQSTFSPKTLIAGREYSAYDTFPSASSATAAPFEAYPRSHHHVNDPSHSPALTTSSSITRPSPKIQTPLNPSTTLANAVPQLSRYQILLNAKFATEAKINDGTSSSPSALARASVESIYALPDATVRPQPSNSTSSSIRLSSLSTPYNSYLYPLSTHSHKQSPPSQRYHPSLAHPQFQNELQSSPYYPTDPPLTFEEFSALESRTVMQGWQQQQQIRSEVDDLLDPYGLLSGDDAGGVQHGSSSAAYQRYPSQAPFSLSSSSVEQPALSSAGSPSAQFIVSDPSLLYPSHARITSSFYTSSNSSKNTSNDYAASSFFEIDPSSHHSPAFTSENRSWPVSSVSSTSAPYPPQITLPCNGWSPRSHPMSVNSYYYGSPLSSMNVKGKGRELASPSEDEAPPGEEVDEEGRMRGLLAKKSKSVAKSSAGKEVKVGPEGLPKMACRFCRGRKLK
jgi:hypothetical protein